MEILQATFKTHTLVTGMLSDGSDREETLIESYDVLVRHNGNTYAGQVADADEESLLAGIAEGILVIVPPSINEVVEHLRDENDRLKSDNLTNKRAIFDLFA